MEGLCVWKLREKEIKNNKTLIQGITSEHQNGTKENIGEIN